MDFQLGAGGPVLQVYRAKARRIVKPEKTVPGDEERMRDKALAAFGILMSATMNPPTARKDRLV
jgi:hypothetical protein